MNLKSKTCKCGHEFTAADIKLPFERVERGFYGGLVKKTSQAKCSCGTVYKLYIRPIRQSWEVVDIEPLAVDYSDMTNAQLMEILTEQGKEIPKKANKTQLMELIGQ